MELELMQAELNSIWNGWQFKELLGEGSFGAVYRIERQEFGRVYESALKVISIPQSRAELDTLVNDGMDDENIRLYLGGVVEDIVGEFDLMYKLRGNTNIVSYEDHAVIEHQDSIGWNIYIRMELLTPLFDYVKHRTLTVRDVIRMGIDMCSALEICQKYNIIHRDIKPENMFVTDLGVFKLGDFGIARQIERTSTNLSKKGTYIYMAPELYKGEKCNSTVDIYSLGIVLYRFLNNNRTPFLPPYPERMRVSDKEKANILRMSGKEIPKPCNAEGRLAEIVLKACAFNPADRYESAVLMREALETILYDEHEVDIVYRGGNDVVNKSHEFSTVKSSKASESETQKMKTSEVTETTVDTPLSEELAPPEETAGEESMYYLFGTEVEASKRKEELRRKVLEEAEKQAESEANIKETGNLREEGNLKQEEQVEIIQEVRKEIPKSDKGADADHKGVGSDYKEAEAEGHADEIGKDETDKSEKEGHDDQKSKNGSSESKNKSSKSKKFLLIALLILLLGAGGGYGGYTYYQKSLEREVPALTNMTLDAATIKAAGDDDSLIVKKSGEEYSDTVEKGNIISQSVEAGTILKKGDEIQVVISKGALKEVPSVTGAEQSAAQEAVEKSNLQFVVTEEQYSDDVAKGKVISQDPAAGSTIEENQTVTVVVSKGIEQVKVPDVKGKSLDKAKEALKSAKLKFGSSTSEYSDSVAEGNVISQSVEAGKTVDKNKKVDLVISKGPKPAPTTSSSSSSSSKKKSSSSSKKKSSSSKKSSGSSGKDSLSNLDTVN